MEVVAQRGESTLGVSTGEMVELISSVSPGPVETLESSLCGEIFLTAEPLAPPTYQVRLVAQTVEVLGEDLQVLGQTHRLQVVRGDELLSYPVKGFQCEIRVMTQSLCY